ncbi:MAG: pilus assembly protein PilP [Nitrospiria bacterium]
MDKINMQNAALIENIPTTASSRLLISLRLEKCAFSILFGALFFVLMSSAFTEAQPPVDTTPLQKTPLPFAEESPPLDGSAPPALEREEEILLEAGLFEYDPKGRRDPFRSLITSSTKHPRIVKSLPPLQRREISDLRLIGIIWGFPGRRALIQMPDGKGYTVQTGTRIGINRGIVHQISESNLVIEELFLNIFNEPKKRLVVMELHPHEEGLE